MVSFLQVLGLEVAPTFTGRSLKWAETGEVIGELASSEGLMEIYLLPGDVSPSGFRLEHLSTSGRLVFLNPVSGERFQVLPSTDFIPPVLRDDVRDARNFATRLAGLCTFFEKVGCNIHYTHTNS